MSSFAHFRHPSISYHVETRPILVHKDPYHYYPYSSRTFPSSRPWIEGHPRPRGETSHGSASYSPRELGKRTGPGQTIYDDRDKSGDRNLGKEGTSLSPEVPSGRLCCPPYVLLSAPTRRLAPSLYRLTPSTPYNLFGAAGGVASASLRLCNPEGQRISPAPPGARGCAHALTSAALHPRPARRRHRRPPG